MGVSETPEKSSAVRACDVSHRQDVRQGQNTDGGGQQPTSTASMSPLLPVT